MLIDFIKNKLCKKRAAGNLPTDKFSGGIVVGLEDNITLGEQVTMGGDVILYANAPIAIGDHTMIGMKTMIHTTTHDYHQHPMWKYRVDKPIHIGKHVWIGTSCVILAGVIIEDYAVIAAGSVVAANVPKGAIVAGNPARIIKYRDPAIYNAPMSIQKISEAVPKEDGHIVKVCKEDIR